MSHLDLGLEKERDDFENKIKELLGFQRGLVQTMAITAFESAEDPWKMDCITFWSGRSAKYMSKAVERHPEDFRNDELSLWDMLALFHLAKLSGKKDLELYAWWKENGLTVDPWALIAKVKAVSSRVKKKTRNRIVVRGNVTFSPKKFTVTLAEGGLPETGTGEYEIFLRSLKEERAKEEFAVDKKLTQNERRKT